MPNRVFLLQTMTSIVEFEVLRSAEVGIEDGKLTAPGCSDTSIRVFTGFVQGSPATLLFDGGEYFLVDQAPFNVVLVGEKVV